MEGENISPLKPIRDNLCLLKAVAFPLKVRTFPVSVGQNLDNPNQLSVYKCISHGASKEERILHHFFPQCSNTLCTMHIILSLCTTEWHGFLYIRAIHSPLQSAHNNGLVQPVGFFRRLRPRPLAHLQVLHGNG